AGPIAPPPVGGAEVPATWAGGYGGATPRTAGLLWPAAPDLSLAILEPRVVRGADQGLLVTGLSFFAAGYVSAILIGVIDQSARNCSTFGGGFGGSSVGCDTWPTAFVPVAGGMLAGKFNGSRTGSVLGIIVGPIVGIIQLAGLSILLHAVIFQTEEVVSGVAVGDARISFAPYASDSEGGAAMRVDF
ncbi:MAG: hypothetical protein M3Y87_26270, partial [Myxococcota bacterium]|nr:hypothetical protein [Myxococcota bacterium]